MMNGRSLKTACVVLALAIGSLQPAWARHARGGAPFIGACPATSGPITINATATRTTGISPMTVFFDATATTYSGTLTGANTPFQDLNYSWTFGDTGTSGTSTWGFGSNVSGNSRNVATGAIATHMYVTSGADQPYTTQITVTDGINTAQCNLNVTAFDPSGSNGFPGTATTCVAATTTPVAGSGDCPTGAAVLEASNISTATTTTILGAGKRALLHCGDTFTGTTRQLGANPATTSGGTPGTATPNWTLGAYGGCEGTQINRPIISLGTVFVDWVAVDGRIMDLDFEGAGGTPSAPATGTATVIGQNFAVQVNPAQNITVYNVLVNGYDESFQSTACNQCAWVQDVQTGMGGNQGTFLNLAENNCSNAANTFAACVGVGFTNNNYNAVMGGSFNGQGAPGTAQGNSNGIETIRISGGDKWVIENNLIENANDVGGVLKFHAGSNKISQCQWTGKTGMYSEISDNTFAGTSGAELGDWIAQNALVDERLQFMVAERNLFAPSTSGHQILLGVINATFRDNVFLNSGISAGNRGFQGTSNNSSGAGCSGTGTTAAPVIALYPQGNEIYNNTFDGGVAPAFGGSNGLLGPANNSFAQNLLLFGTGAILNQGSNNAVSNNTATTSLNPGFVNASGTLGFISDFKPTANFTISCTTFPGCTAVPVQFDALGVAWPPTWDLGAVHH
jgi:hypothetical protein